MARREPPLVGPAAMAALARRPGLWPTALRVAAAFVKPGWWKSWPPLPRLPADYEHFRRQTMFGSAGDARLEPSDLIAYLTWCRRMDPRARRAPR